MKDDEVEEVFEVAPGPPLEMPLPGFKLDYRSPQALQKYPRGGSVGKGFGAVWATVIAAIALQYSSGGSTLFTTLVLGGVVSIIYGILDSTKKRHFAFFSGIIIGVSTVIGVAGLIVAVVCGAFRH